MSRRLDRESEAVWAFIPHPGPAPCRQSERSIPASMISLPESGRFRIAHSEERRGGRRMAQNGTCRRVRP